jgi:hypothetical protein
MVQDSLRALELKLSKDDLTRIEQAVPADTVAGTRYVEPLMKMHDSQLRL